jgi:uncharacterized protein YfaT (DUF1175 family)
MSEVSDLSEVVNDGVLSESYFILRQTGHFGSGGWIIDSSSKLNGWGVVSVATEEDLLMIQEGDRVTGIMVFHSEKRIYETQLDTSPVDSLNLQKFSDIMIWNYQQWRVLAVGPYPNRKFWRALAVRMAGV